MKKAGLIFLCYILSLSFLLSGCAINQLEDDEYVETYSYDDESFEETYNSDYESSDVDYEDVPKEILEKTFKLSAKKSADFRNYVSSVNVAFDEFDDADIKKCLNTYYALKNESAPKSSSIIKNRKVDFDTLYSVIKKNSAANTDTYYKGMPNDDELKKL